MYYKTFTLHMQDTATIVMKVSLISLKSIFSNVLCKPDRILFFLLPDNLSPYFLYITWIFLFYNRKFLFTVSKLSFCAVFFFTYPLFVGIICLTSTENLSPHGKVSSIFSFYGPSGPDFPFIFSYIEKRWSCAHPGNIAFYHCRRRASYGSFTGKGR